MNFIIGWHLSVLLLAAMSIESQMDGIDAAPAKEKYDFVPAKCTQHPNAEQRIGGPLYLCTFPPKYEPITQEDIEEVINHVQSLNL